FGLAKLTEKKREAVNSSSPRSRKFRTGAGMVLGTVGYMAPEQARGERVDPRTDIFSLGVVIYEMIAGPGPFAAPTMADTIAAILGTEAVPLGQLASDIPVALERIVDKSLRKSREDRYQSAGQLLVELKNLRLELEVDRRRHSFEPGIDKSESLQVADLI